MTRKVPCEVFSRIVGYYRPLQNWNAGKLEEYYDRKFFKVADEGAGLGQGSCSCVDESVNLVA